MARKRNQPEAEETPVAVVEVDELEELTTEEDEAQETFTPTEIANGLNMDPKQLRAYLRANYTRDPSMKEKSWHLNAEVAAQVIEHFTRSKEENVVTLEDAVDSE